MTATKLNAFNEKQILAPNSWSTIPDRAGPASLAIFTIAELKASAF